MKKRIIAILLLVILGALCFAACGDSGSSTGGTGENTVIYSVDGINIKSATVVMVGETPNLQLVYGNSTDKDVEFDVSKLMVKLADGTEIANFGLSRTVAANTPRTQVTFSIQSKYGIKLGDTVDIYYGSDKIATTTVEEF